MLDVASTMILTTLSVFLFTQADLMIVGMYTMIDNVDMENVEVVAAAEDVVVVEEDVVVDEEGHEKLSLAPTNTIMN